MHQLAMQRENVKGLTCIPRMYVQMKVSKKTTTTTTNVIASVSPTTAAFATGTTTAAFVTTTAAITAKNFVFQHPFTVSVSGQTGSGKTYFVKMLMRHCKIKVSLPPERDIILWLYDIIKFTVYPHVEFIMGISLDLEQVPERETKTVNISHREDAPSSQPHRVPSTDQLPTFSEQTEASISSKYAPSSQTHHKSPFSNQLRTLSEKTEASISHSVMTVAFLLKTCTTYRDM